MSRIVIVGQEIDLEEWLAKHDLKILLRRNAFGGWCADFEGPIFIEGQSTDMDLSKNGEIEAVHALLLGLRGCKIGKAGPAHVVVPKFSGVAQAVRAALAEAGQ